MLGFREVEKSLGGRSAVEPCEALGAGEVGWWRRSVLVLVFCLSQALSAGAEDPACRNPDRAMLEHEVQEVLKEHGGPIQAGLWLGGRTGEAWYSQESGRPQPTASAIKTSFLIELFGRYAEALDQPPPGLAAILEDSHPAIAHFEPAARQEVRRELTGASVRKIGGVMMGSEPASNLVYNAAANVTTALLGGPDGLTKAIRNRDPSFQGISVRRYMLADRRAHGDNEASTEALAAVLQRLADGKVPGLDKATVEAIRKAILSADDPTFCRHHYKHGDLSTDPITHVLSGWYDVPGSGPLVYVVMVAQSDPVNHSRKDAHQHLVATALRLQTLLLKATR